MFKKGRNSFKKNMAILVCVAFISMVSPQVVHTEHVNSSEALTSPEVSFSLFSSLFSFASFNFSLLVSDLAMIRHLAKNDPKPTNEEEPDPNKDKEDPKNYVKKPANSTSKKKPKVKD